MFINHNMLFLVWFNRLTSEANINVLYSCNLDVKPCKREVLFFFKQLWVIYKNKYSDPKHVSLFNIRWCYKTVIICTQVVYQFEPNNRFLRNVMY